MQLMHINELITNKLHLFLNRELLVRVLAITYSHIQGTTVCTKSVYIGVIMVYWYRRRRRHHHHQHHHHELWSVRRSACSLSLKVKLVLPSFPGASYVSLPPCPILQCLFGYPVCARSLYVFVAILVGTVFLRKEGGNPTTRLTLRNASNLSGVHANLLIKPSQGRNGKTVDRLVALYFASYSLTKLCANAVCSFVYILVLPEDSYK
jgi:hypothetical protein